VPPVLPAVAQLLSVRRLAEFMGTIFFILIVAGIFFLIVLSAALWTYRDMKKKSEETGRDSQDVKDA
jgi:cytochrome bd-type quinol oxidase subunit 2